MSKANGVNFGLIGCGNLGADLAERFKSIEDGKIVVVNDIDPTKGKDLATKIGAVYLPDLDELLSHRDLHAVIVAAPNHLHPELTIKVASAGKHVFCEKPMALTVADCNRMIAATRKNRVKLMVGHVLRLFPLFATAKKIIDGGALGEISSISLRRLARLDLESSWRKDKGLSGGGLFEVSVHELDFMRYLAGEVEEVYCLMDNHIPGEIDYEASASVSLRFANGAVGNLNSSTVSTINLNFSIFYAFKPFS